MILQIILETQLRTMLVVHNEDMTDVVKVRDVEINGKIITKIHDGYIFIYPDTGEVLGIEDMGDEDVLIYTHK